MDVKFLDFQQVTCGSPAIDLTLFFYSGVSKENLDRFDELMQLYIEVFSDTLEKISYKPQKPYTLEMLRDEWKQNAKFGLASAIMVWRTKFADISKIAKVVDNPPEGSDLILVDEEYKDECENQLRAVVTHFYKNNFL